MATWGKAEAEAKKEGKAASWQPALLCLSQSRSCVHRSQVGRRHFHPLSGLLSARKITAWKHNKACWSLCAENPDESSGIHLLMIESGPDCIIFSVMENITLHHHNHNMLQASLYTALMKWACGLGFKSPDKTAGAVCVCVRVCPLLCESFRFYNISECTEKMACIPLSRRHQSARADSRYAQYSPHSLGQSFQYKVEQRRKQCPGSVCCMKWFSFLLQHTAKGLLSWCFFCVCCNEF